MSKFVVKDIKILTSWGYNLPTNIECTICRCNLNTNSLYNQDKCEDSIIVRGTCNHSFHDECIRPWIKTNNHCPICSQNWIFVK